MMCTTAVQIVCTRNPTDNNAYASFHELMVVYPLFRFCWSTAQ